jgi:hypothetical protein
MDYKKHNEGALMTRTQRRRNTVHPTRDGKHNPICVDPDCVDCKKIRPWGHSVALEDKDD